MFNKGLFLQAVFFIFLAVLLGLARQFAPNGIAWSGQWPTAETSSRDAYAMMAKPGDPPFVSLQDMIEIQQNKDAVIIDARASKEFVNGYIPGSRNLPYYEIEQYQEAALAGVKANTQIVIYCEGIGCELSFFLGRELKEVGYNNIGIFYGGYPEWQQAGLPIEK